MPSLSHNEIVILLIQLGVLMLASRLLGELARWLKQPSVVGEIFAGIMLGPTVMGFVKPEWFAALFPKTGHEPYALNGITAISSVMLLFVAGLEVELHIIYQQGKRALVTSLGGISLSFALGFSVVWLFPGFFESIPREKIWVLSLFLGIALSITALPVIAKTLIDLNLFKSRFGLLIIATAMMDDLTGWMIFSVVLSMMKGSEMDLAGIGSTIGLTLLFALGMLTIGRILFDKMLPIINKRFAWPGGVLSIGLSFCFMGAAFTESIGIHAIFGAFIVGIAFGDSKYLSDHAKEIIHQFITNIFAPLFFATIGLKINFITNFDLALTLIILLFAFMGKVIGCGLASYWSGFSKKQAVAIGFAMNSRGAMEIILGMIALENGLINETIFVSLVIMALLTSMTSGFFIKRFIGQEQVD